MEIYRYSSLGFVERDSSEENEGYTFVCDLEDQKIEEFLIESARYGFILWEELYVNENVADGHQWGTTITFSDSTTKTISGSNKYPETWDKIYKAFMDLTGEDILLHKSNWLGK